MAPLDSTVAQVVFVARVLEKAVHSEGTWTMAWGPHEVPAVRVLTDDGVLFSADFPEACYLEQIDSPLVLLLDGETVTVRSMEHPGDTGFTVNWEIQGRLTSALA